MKSFPHTLIPMELKIICKVLWGKENIQGGVGGSAFPVIKFGGVLLAFEYIRPLSSC
jgi:hypothetical protein